MNARVSVPNGFKGSTYERCRRTISRTGERTVVTLNKNPYQAEIATQFEYADFLGVATEYDPALMENVAQGVDGSQQTALQRLTPLAGREKDSTTRAGPACSWGQA